jgi:hypothetical protein
MTEHLRVLLVEADPEEAARFGAWLEGDGAEVLECPGPSAPEYTCVGARTRCPLIDGADVVVLDMSLKSESVMLGTAAEELLGRYLLTGRPVVTLGSRPAPDEPGELVRLRRHPDRSTLIAAVRSLRPRAPRTPLGQRGPAPGATHIVTTEGQR